MTDCMTEYGATFIPLDYLSITLLITLKEFSTCCPRKLLVGKEQVLLTFNISSQEDTVRFHQDLNLLLVVHSRGVCNTDI